MNIIDVIQGESGWHEHRRSMFNASDAPAMMGLSPYKTRSELLREIATGITPEIDPATQRRFDDGHRFEALARPVAENILGKELFPVVGYEGKLSASFDGLTMDGQVCWEHKTLNAAYRAAIDTGYTLPAALLVQIEQQMMIADAPRCLFMASRWNDDDTLAEEVHCFVDSSPELRKVLLQGWTQFAIDLEAYVHVDVIPAAVAAPQMALPAVFIQVNGSIALTDNLTGFGEALTAYVERINKKPETDQDFADLEATVKTLKTAEEALDAAENSALGQAASIDTMRRAVALYRAIARDNRLMIDKLVKAEKENRKAEIIRSAQDVMMKYTDKLNERVGGYMPRTIAPFAEAIKGLKSLDSMRDKVSAALANAKITANEIADTIQANRLEMEGELDWSFLFPDFAAVCTKARDDFDALLMSRIAKHNEAQAAKDKAAKDAEAARIAAAVEAERKAGEARAAAAIAVEAKRVADIAEFDKQIAAHQEAEAKRVAEAAQQVQRGKTEDATHAVQNATELPQAPAAITPPTPEEKRAVLVEAGDDVRAYLNTLGLNDKEFGRMRAVLMGYEQFKAQRALKAAS